MAKTNDSTNGNSRLIVANTSSLEDYKKKKAALDAEVESIKAAAEAKFNKLVSEASDVAAEYRTEFGTRIPSPFTVTKLNTAPSTGVDGRAVGGLKRALNAATKRGDATKIAEINAKIAALTPPAAPAVGGEQVPV